MLALAASFLVTVVHAACLPQTTTEPWPDKPSDKPPVRVFVLAGQSNMEGQGVVDLERDHNDGRGTLVSLFEKPATAPLVAHLRNDDGSWRVRDDVFVRYTPEGDPAAVGPLTFGFTPYRDQHHFGPELEIGHILGDAIEEPVLLVKTAWGGKSLFVDFRPPSAGGTVGPYYTRMINDVRTAIAKAGAEIPALKDRQLEVAGFIWYHGWNDGCDPQHAVPEYEANLVHLIHDVRRELGVPELPAVVGEITGAWVEATGEWAALRKAQAAASRREEWNGRVLFAPTAAFVRDPNDSPCPTHGHHEFGNAETYFLVGKALGEAMRSLVVPNAPAFVPTLPVPPKVTTKEGEMSGYMLVPTEQVPKEFNAGFSLYAAAWPIVDHYPGSRFQTGLFGTWMFAQFVRQVEGDAPKDMYSDIEGGLGWWRDTRFATNTPKFIMGGVAPNFCWWANGPGAGSNRDWSKPAGKYGIAQLSPWVVWPPDGLNLAQGTCGELFGYGYLPLPLVDAKPTTAGKPIPSGGQCWTLFLNTANFKGPVAFFTPHHWTAALVEHPELAGKLLDTRGSDPNKAFQMETQWIPATIATIEGGASDGQTYARVAPTSYPLDKDGKTVVLHRLMSYTGEALTEPLRRWFAGGSAVSGEIDPTKAHVQAFGQGGGSTWRIFRDGTPDPERRDIAWQRFGRPITHDPFTFGYQWDERYVRTVDEGSHRVARLPEYFRLEKRKNRANEEQERQRERWIAVEGGDVPEATGLHDHRYETPKEEGEGPYVTPEEPNSSFRQPGPVAGPFEITLGDGSVLTYAWYRFADQPAMLNADLTAAEREEVQRRVELLHRAWTKDRTYLPPPTTGTLASIDPALLVTPPKGFEVGYVPIAIKQRPKAGPRAEH
jgi:hypothetical protein